MIKYYTNKKVDYNKLIKLFNEVGWDDKTNDIDRLKKMVENSQVVVTAWDNENMIGFARCITDFVYNGQINNVVVDVNYRGKGIGKEMIRRTLNSSEKVTYILRGDPENIKFYRKLGFEEANLSLVYKRNE